MPPILELHGITKSFPGVLANDHIDLTLVKVRSCRSWGKTAQARPP